MEGGRGRSSEVRQETLLATNVVGARVELDLDRSWRQQHVFRAGKGVVGYQREFTSRARRCWIGNGDGELIRKFRGEFVLVLRYWLPEA